MSAHSSHTFNNQQNNYYVRKSMPQLIVDNTNSSNPRRRKSLGKNRRVGTNQAGGMYLNNEIQALGQIVMSLQNKMDYTYNKNDIINNNNNINGTYQNNYNNNQITIERDEYSNLDEINPIASLINDNNQTLPNNTFNNNQTVVGNQYHLTNINLNREFGKYDDIFKKVINKHIKKEDKNNEHVLSKLFISIINDMAITTINYLKNIIKLPSKFCNEWFKEKCLPLNISPTMTLRFELMFIINETLHEIDIMENGVITPKDNDKNSKTASQQYNKRYMNAVEKFSNFFNILLLYKKHFKIFRFDPGRHKANLKFKLINRTDIIKYNQHVKESKNNDSNPFHYEQILEYAEKTNKIKITEKSGGLCGDCYMDKDTNFSAGFLIGLCNVSSTTTDKVSPSTLVKHQQKYHKTSFNTLMYVFLLLTFSN